MCREGQTCGIYESLQIQFTVSARYEMLQIYTELKYTLNYTQRRFGHWTNIYWTTSRGGSDTELIYTELHPEEVRTPLRITTTNHYKFDVLCLHVINDIDLHQNEGSLLLYADDLLYHPIQSPEDYLKLQGDIDQLQAWSETNVLFFNQLKQV